MLLDEFLEQEVEYREEMHYPVVLMKRWEYIALLLWKNGGNFNIGVCNTGLARHRTMTGLQVMELFEFKAVLFGAGMYSGLWDLEYVPKVQKRFKELDEHKKRMDDIVKWN
jgi:hypothetical protein